MTFSDICRETVLQISGSYVSQLKEESTVRIQVQRIQGMKVIWGFSLLVLGSKLRNPVDRKGYRKGYQLDFASKG